MVNAAADNNEVVEPGIHKNLIREMVDAAAARNEVVEPGIVVSCL